MSGPERLQKVLARSGVASRRAVEDLIRAGRVRVNGEVAVLGQRVDPARDAVEVDGFRIPLDPDLVYLALHKPAGVVTTARDPGRRPTVLDLLPSRPRVFPVGRLDRDTSGLLLLTNDGDFAHRMTHPRYGVPKTYVAEVRGELRPGLALRLRRGVELDKSLARAERVRVRRGTRGRHLVELTVREGRNRLVRRLLASQGLEVRTLVRTRIGGVELGRLGVGEWRSLHRHEVLELLGEANRLH